jgi:glutamate-1-semialdehyde 2,1-aminomutase
MLAASKLIEAYSLRRGKSAACFERAAGVLAGKVGHDLRYSEPMPLYIQRAKGGRKWDVDSNEYVDFLLGNGALLLGHAVPEVLEAIARAATKGTHFGNDHPLQIEWAELTQQMVPSAERIRFVNSGSEATTLAIRLARAFTRRNKLLRFEGHFHGWHDELVHGFQPPFEASGSLGVPPPSSSQCDFYC